MKIKAYGKINLTLDVVNKRDDGYHIVEMIMQKIGLYDEITIEPQTIQKISITTNSRFIPKNHRNIVYKVADYILKEYSIKSGLLIDIHKNIPVAAGLAGGSTDAASTIKALDKIFNLNLSMDDMQAIGLKFGADIPFCLQDQTVIARGIGEKLEVIEGLKSGWIILVKPNLGVSTQKVYKALDYKNINKHPNTEKMVSHLKEDNIYKISEELINVLEEVTLKMYPEVLSIKQRLKSYGAKGVLMSGSGPTVFGLFNKRHHAQKAYKNLSRYYKEVFIVRPYNGGGGCC